LVGFKAWERSTGSVRATVSVSERREESADSRHASRCCGAIEGGEAGLELQPTERSRSAPLAAATLMTL
jgi:hypothetical protein